MKQSNNQTQVKSKVAVSVFTTKNGDAIIHKISDQMRFEMPINFYKKLFAIEFIPKQKGASSSLEKTRQYGFIAKPNVYITEDGKYLVHEILGNEISKPVNYYLKIIASLEEKSKGANQVA